MELRNKAISGVKWNTISTIVCSVIGILKLSVLTYLLDKSDFGLIAIAMMVISFTDIFSELGITVALIHKQDITDRQYSSVYWLNIATSIIMTIVVCLFAPLVADFYNEPILVPIIMLLSLQVLFNGFGKMFQTIKTRDLEFDYISKVKMATFVIGFIATVAFAFFDYGVYSLVYGQLIQIGLTQVIFAFSGIKSNKITFHFSYNEIRDIVHIGVFKLGSKILDAISAKIDVFLIGRFFSMDVLGIYNIAKELVVLPYGVINKVSLNVFSAVFAKIQKDINSVERNFAKVLSMTAIFTCLIYAIMFSFSELIVYILYDSAYAEVAVFMQILVLTGILSSIDSQGGSLQVAYGRTDLELKWTTVRIFLSSAILLLTSNISIYAVAFGAVFVSVVSVFIRYNLIIKKILVNLTLSRYLAMFSKIIGIAFIWSFPVFLIIRLFEPGIIFQILLLCVLVSGYTICIRFTNKDLFNESLSIVTKFVKK